MMDAADNNLNPEARNAVLLSSVMIFGVLGDEEMAQSTSEDEDDDEDCYQTLEKVHDYAEYTVPRQTHQQFREHFRMLPETYEYLLGRINGYLMQDNLQNSPGRPIVDSSKQLLVGLWVLANRESFRSVGDRFGIAKSTAWNCTRRLCSALLELNREHGIISWPNAARRRSIVQGFKGNQNRGFPGAIGAIDGCHIPIPAPKVHHTSYINRKGFHSVLLQGVCDHQMLFIDCYAGESGAIHDSCMYTRSDLSTRIAGGEADIDDGFHLIGDSAYPLRTKMMVPYKGDVTRDEKNFNTILSRSRNVIERCFALLKGRFRRLKYLEMTKVEMIPLVIVACCILHNICIIQDEWEWLNDEDFNFESDGENESDEEHIIGDVGGHVGHENVEQQRARGQAKRNALKDILRNRNNHNN